MKATRGKVWFALVAAGVSLLGVRESVAQLVVNRGSGAITFVAPAGDPLEVNGYSIASGNALLNPETWNSLTDQSIEGWSEANPRTEMLSELNPLSFTDPVGNTWSLGNAYAGTTLPPTSEDLTVQYSLTDGSVVDGSVEYLGAINDLVLLVDPDTGAGAIELKSANVGPFDVTGYSIFSPSGALATDTFTGLGEGWTIANPQSTALADLNLEGSMMFDTNASASLGTIFTVGGEQDLAFEYSTVAGDLLTGTVSFGGMDNEEDCNGDGVVDINDANCTPDNQLDAFLAGLDPPSLRGDADGDGEVQFSDFVILSDNFTLDGQYTTGDFDKDGVVQFSDFVILSDSFGQTGGAVAAAVPEPATGLLALLGIVGLSAIRRRMRPRLGHLLAACLGLVLVAGATDAVQAQMELPTRLIRIEGGDNPEINSTEEAIGILNGTVAANIVEDVTDVPTDWLDYGGGACLFQTNNPYPNGVSDTSMSDFALQVTGAFLIPEGDWTIGHNRDDGGRIQMARVNFVEKFGQLTGDDPNDPTTLMYNGTGGCSTTAMQTWGHFTAPAGGLRTEFEFVGFERGGGDGFEAAFSDGFVDGTDLAPSQLGWEVGDTTLGWEQIDPPGPGDFNWDDVVDMGDFGVLSDNFGTGTSFAQGDGNGDGVVDLVDFVEFLPLLTAQAGVASVPEPSSLALLSLASGALLLAARRRRK